LTFRFSKDGTLIDYEGASHEALERPLQRRGKDLSWELHASIVGTRPDSWSVNVLSACGLTHEKLTPEKYQEEYFKEVHDMYPAIKAWPGTLSLLSRLKRKGFRLAIATSTPKLSFDDKMVHHPEILAAMDAVVTGDEVSNGKPAPDIFIEAARRIGCDPAHCIVFEDSPLGIEGAHAAGCMAVALPDARMSVNDHRFTELGPKWLFSTIGDFDVDSIVKIAPSSSGSEAATEAHDL